MPAAVMPLSTERPLSEPIMVRPRRPSMNSSGLAKESTSGCTIGIDRPMNSPPSTPPIAEQVNAAPKARAASPRFANG